MQEKVAAVESKSRGRKGKILFPDRYALSDEDRAYLMKQNEISMKIDEVVQRFNALVVKLGALEEQIGV